MRNRPLIKLTEEDLKKIVTSSVLKVLKEQEFGQLSLDSNPSLRVVFVGRDEILSVSDLIWNMLSLSYSSIGGLKTYKNKEDFLRKVKYAKFVYEGNEIVACSIYRKMENSYKMVAIGCNQENNGKLGVQEIIKSDIEQLDYHFWAEVSGAIEHFFKKYNGYPMPNTLATKILNMPSSSIRLSNTDLLHYEREIGGMWLEKSIFGIRSEEIYQEAIRAVGDYSKFMEDVNTITESKIRGLKYTLKQAVYIVENIYREHEENDFNELIPSWYEALKESQRTFMQYKKMDGCPDYVDDYLEYCDYLFKTMTPLKLHKLVL